MGVRLFLLVSTGNREQEALPDGRLFYQLKHRWREATTHVICDPLELVELIAALLPA
jgi:hypothetical protein